MRQTIIEQAYVYSFYFIASYFYFNPIQNNFGFSKFKLNFNKMKSKQANARENPKF